MVLDVDRAQTVEIDADLKAGESLVFDGGPEVRVYDAKGRQKAVIAPKRPVPQLARGKQDASFECAFAGDTPTVVDAVTFRTRGEAEPCCRPLLLRPDAEIGSPDVDPVPELVGVLLHRPC